MTTPSITVRGSYRAFRPPERATVQLRLGLEGPKPAPVHDAVGRLAAQVADSLRALHDPSHGPVTWWSSDQLRTWAQRPWNQDGRQLPLVHHAQVDVRAKFSDFERLSAWLGEVAGVGGVSVGGIDWTITEARKRELVAQVRTAAVHDARDRAQAFADALDLGPVRVARLADAGMLADGVRPAGGVEAAGFSRMAKDSSSPGVELTPQDVEVACEVDAEFVADVTTSAP